MHEIFHSKELLKTDLSICEKKVKYKKDKWAKVFKDVVSGNIEVLMQI